MRVFSLYSLKDAVLIYQCCQHMYIAYNKLKVMELCLELFQKIK